MRALTRRHGAAATFAAASRPPAKTKWRDAGWCALDLELTGLNPVKDEIIAVGAIPIDEGRLRLGNSVYTLVRSSRRSQRDAVLMHKLRVADVADAPSLDAAIDLVLESLSGRVPVFHTAAVERSFLSPRFAERGVRLPAAADTEALGRLLLRERDHVAAGRLPLPRLASILALPSGPAHHALGDALTTGAAFIALATQLDVLWSQTVRSLVRADELLRGPRRLG